MYIFDLPSINANLTNKKNGNKLIVRSSFACTVNILPFDSIESFFVVADGIDLKHSKQDIS